MNMALWLDRTARIMGDRPALLLGRRQVADYESFARRAAGLAATLARDGIAPGDRVGIFAKNVPDYLICLYAIWRAGRGGRSGECQAAPEGGGLDPLQRRGDIVLRDRQLGRRSGRGHRPAAHAHWR